MAGRRNAPPGHGGAGKMRIATASGLAMTEVVVSWSRFAGGAVVVDGVYCGTVITVPYIWT